MKRILPILFALQCLLIAVVCFGDIGFDMPGRFGLDFSDFLLLSAIYLALLVSGVGYAAVHKQWRWLALQVAFPLIVYTCATFLITYKVPYAASEHQHLIGMTKAEVHELLGARNRTTAGGMGSTRVGDKNIDYEFEPYNGMVVYYEPGGPVIAVERPGEMKFLSE